TPRGRGALRDRIAERSRRLFGARAPLVDALVIARRTELDAELRERCTRSGFVAGTCVMLAYVWLLGFPAPATRSAAMLAFLDIGKLRQRIVAPRGLVALTALCVMLSDPWAVQSAGAWL